MGTKLFRACLGALAGAAVLGMTAAPAGALPPHTLAGAATANWAYGAPLTAVPTTMGVFLELGVIGVIDQTPVNLGTILCQMLGEGLESLEFGQGSVSGGCTTTGGNVDFTSCTVFYTRVAAVVELTGNCAVSNGQTAVLAGSVVWATQNVGAGAVVITTTS